MDRKKIVLGRRIMIISIIIGIIISGNIFGKMKLIGETVAEAKNVEATLNIMGINSPIRMAFLKRVRALEEAKAEKIVKEARRLAEIKRMEDELKFQKEEEERIKNQKVAYLTFDDGPSESVTPMILDILKEYDIKATFFVVGKMAEKNQEILIRTWEEGHKIANHSYSHDYNYLYKNSKNFMADINKANKVLKDILGSDFENNIIRFPGGSFGKQKSPMKNAAIEAGYKYYDWNALNGDAEGVNLTEKYLINRLKETTKNKKEVTILMHDTDAKMKTANTLREILDYLISEGYEFKILE